MKIVWVFQARKVDSFKAGYLNNEEGTCFVRELHEVQLERLHQLHSALQLSDSDSVQSTNRRTIEESQIACQLERRATCTTPPALVSHCGDRKHSTDSSRSDVCFCSLRSQLRFTVRNGTACLMARGIPRQSGTWGAHNGRGNYLHACFS